MTNFQNHRPGEWLEGFGISSVIYTDPDFIHVWRVVWPTHI